MAHFYGTLQGNRGETSRTGSKQSGINGHIRGWNIGVYVSLDYNEETGLDTVKVYRTKGSNGFATEKLIAEFTE